MLLSFQATVATGEERTILGLMTRVFPVTVKGRATDHRRDERNPMQKGSAPVPAHRKSVLVNGLAPALRQANNSNVLVDCASCSSETIAAKLTLARACTHRIGKSALRSIMARKRTSGEAQLRRCRAFISAGHAVRHFLTACRS